MKTLFQVLLPVILGVFAIAGEAPRVNELQKQYGGPFADLPQVSRDQAIRYFETFISGFRSLGATGLGDTDTFQSFYTTKLLPLIQPLESGNATEKKVFKAAQAVYETMEYVSANMKVEKGAWDNQQKNDLLRLHRQPVDPVSLSVGIGELLLDFRQITDPSGFDAFRRTAEHPNKEAEQPADGNPR